LLENQQKTDSTSGPVSTGMGDRLRRINPLSISPSHPGQLSLLPQRDGKWVRAKVRWWSAAGE